MTIAVYGEHDPPPRVDLAADALASAGLAVSRTRALKAVAGYLKELVETESLEHEAIVITYAANAAARQLVAKDCHAVFRDDADASLPGFGEAVRRIALDAIGPEAILLRAPAGSVNECLVFAMPAIEALVRPVIASLLAHVIRPQTATR